MVPNTQSRWLEDRVATTTHHGWPKCVAEGWAVFFRSEFLGSRAPSVFLLWRAHPLLFPSCGARPEAPTT
jgi:hypothetical protein